eukprot:33717-Rhodomonas_salina.1
MPCSPRSAKSIAKKTTFLEPNVERLRLWSLAFHSTVQPTAGGGRQLPGSSIDDVSSRNCTGEQDRRYQYRTLRSGWVGGYRGLRGEGGWTETLGGPIPRSAIPVSVILIA